MFIKKQKGIAPTPKFGVSLQGKRGFTLIELLVVIAIIGLLSSVVLVSMSGSRKAAKDSNIIMAIGQTRIVAEITMASNDTYAALCGSATTLGTTNDLPKLQASIYNNQATNSIGCNATASSFCVSALLSTSKYSCVDSTGIAKNTSTAKCSVTITACN